MRGTIRLFATRAAGTACRVHTKRAIVAASGASPRQTVCFRGLQKDNLPKPQSSLRAIDLKLQEDHEYLVRSVAHHLGLSVPILSSLYGVGLSPVAALGGPEAEKLARR